MVEKGNVLARLFDLLELFGPDALLGLHLILVLLGQLVAMLPGASFESGLEVYGRPLIQQLHEVHELLVFGAAFLGLEDLPLEFLEVAALLVVLFWNREFLVCG